jgi:pyruvate dehydrogenase E2 component (dihydrolipoamide acetyltransferase)
MKGADTLIATLPDERRLSVAHWEGHGAPLVLIHGLFDSSSGWERLARATHRPCFAVDLPGFGGSDCPKDASMSSYAHDVSWALSDLGVRDYTLVGHSLGGAVATALAEEAPDEVACLALMAPVGFGRLPVSEALGLPVVRDVARLAVPMALANPLTCAGIYAAMVGNWHAPERALLRRLARGAWSAGPAAAVANRAIVESGLSQEAFHRRRVLYEGPVAALWGKSDRLVPPAHAKAVCRSLPQARVTMWPGMAHHAQQERPVELAAFIESSCCRARRARCASHRAQRRQRVAPRPTAHLAQAA